MEDIFTYVLNHPIPEFEEEALVPGKIEQNFLKEITIIGARRRHKMLLLEMTEVYLKTCDYDANGNQKDFNLGKLSITSFANIMYKILLSKGTVIDNKPITQAIYDNMDYEDLRELVMSFLNYAFAQQSTKNLTAN